MDYQIAVDRSINKPQNIWGWDEGELSPWKNYSSSQEKMQFQKWRSKLDKEKKGHCSQRDKEQWDLLRNCRCIMPLSLHVSLVQTSGILEFTAEYLFMNHEDFYKWINSLLGIIAEKWSWKTNERDNAIRKGIETFTINFSPENQMGEIKSCGHGWIRRLSYRVK